MTETSYKENYPILYTFRRCPFAIRARTAIYFSEAKVEIREVLLKDKPVEMTSISKKSTVPILKLDQKVIDESLDIMLWALKLGDKKNLLSPYRENKEYVLKFIKKFDIEYKYHLDRYKYDNRYINDKEYIGKLKHRDNAYQYLNYLNQLLLNNKSNFLYKEELSILDISIFPLIRQFRIADQNWFDTNQELFEVKKWLDNLINSIFFKKVMYKYPVWNNSEKKSFFHHLI